LNNTVSEWVGLGDGEMGRMGEREIGRMGEWENG